MSLLNLPLTASEVRKDNSVGQSAASRGSRVLSIVDPMIQVRDVNLKYGAKQPLFNVNLDIPGKKATAFIGPSGCGKSTLLRCLNRMNDLIDGTRVARGTIRIHGVDIYQPDVDVIVSGSAPISARWRWRISPETRHLPREPG